MDDITLISSDQLAVRFGYEGPNGAFREFCKRLNIRPVPGRKSFFDPLAVRRRLDEAQGLGMSSNDMLSHVQKRRIRNGT